GGARGSAYEVRSHRIAPAAAAGAAEGARRALDLTAGRRDETRLRDAEARTTFIAARAGSAGRTAYLRVHDIDEHVGDRCVRHVTPSIDRTHIGTGARIGVANARVDCAGAGVRSTAATWFAGSPRASRAAPSRRSRAGRRVGAAVTRGDARVAHRPDAEILRAGG